MSPDLRHVFPAQSELRRDRPGNFTFLGSGTLQLGGPGFSLANMRLLDFGFSR
jgi:hypothetical protein